MRFESPFVLRAFIIAQQQDQSPTQSEESLKEHEQVAIADFAQD
jgi:hypothetical protein